MSQMKLYEIANEYQNILSSYYDSETGEVDEASLAKIDAIKESLDNKCVAVACYIENMKAECKAISEAKNKMADRELRFKKQLKNLKNYLMQNMEKSNIKKVSCAYFDIAIKKNPPAVEIYDQSVVPLDYDKVEIKKDTAKMREDMLKGIEIPGARLIQKKNISIK